MFNASIIVAGGLLFAMAGAAFAAPLDGLRWNARPLIVFAPSENDERLVDQRSRLAAAEAGIGERDMIVLVVAGAKAESAAGDAAAPDATALRRTYGVADDAFAVVLVGKDGGEKYRSEAVVAPEAIFGIVDAMPMRAQEMRSGR